MLWTPILVVLVVKGLDEVRGERVVVEVKMLLFPLTAKLFCVWIMLADGRAKAFVLVWVSRVLAILIKEDMNEERRGPRSIICGIDMRGQVGVLSGFLSGLF